VKRTRTITGKNALMDLKITIEQNTRGNRLSRTESDSKFEQLTDGIYEVLLRRCDASKIKIVQRGH